MKGDDTSEAAHAFQVGRYRAMTDTQRAELALTMSDDARRISEEGILQRHPEYSPRDVRRALVALLYGRDAAAKIWPGATVPVP